MKTVLSTSDGPDDGRKNTVSFPLTSGRPRRTVETPEFAAFNRRIVRALAKRIAVGGDIEGLRDLVAHADEIDHAIRLVISGLREEHGYSWTDIGRVLRVRKQSAQRRWGLKDGDQ